MSTREEIIQERLGRYFQLAAQIAKGKSLEREDYVLQKFRNVVPNALRALEKIREGTGNECDECGDEISPERLAAVPAAIRCNACQKKYESRPGVRT